MFPRAAAKGVDSRVEQLPAGAQMASVFIQGMPVHTYVRAAA